MFKIILRNSVSIGALFLGAMPVWAADDTEPSPPSELALQQVAALQPPPSAGTTETVRVTARLREEDPQNVPISLSVINLDMLDKTSTVNISQLSQLVPSLNYSSPNPRNTAYTIRGLGSSVVAIAQANDGLEPGVGFYVDGVYQARPAAAAFDFIDVERIEVLRGPQGTLFGKNTTAGAINITTRAPSFEREIDAEVTAGNLGFVQSKASVSGALLDNIVAGRFSASMTRRDGVIRNVTTGVYNNNVNNYGFHGQILYRPNDSFRFLLSGDYSAFDSNCCTQVYVRVGTNLKPAAAQYPALAAGKNYTPPSLNPYDRITDIDAALGVATSQGGLSGTADWDIGPATLTSISSWRFWDWDAANDRDYTGLSIQTVQHIPSRQIQYSQEFRVSSNGQNTVDYVAGLYGFWQTLKGHPITQYGPVAAYWLLGPPPGIPSNLLDGYVTEGQTKFTSASYAAFGEFTWHITGRLSLSPGIRYTYENKDGTFASAVSGGLATTDANLISKKLSILRPQSYAAHVSDGSASGRISADYRLTGGIMAYVSYAQGFKSGGLNMSGLPLNASNQPALATAAIKPEKDSTSEIGFKTDFFGNRLLFNIDAYETLVRDYQTNVVDTGPGALRGYIANIDRVRVKGVEIDSTVTFSENLSAHLSTAWTDGKYISYVNGPCPLERIASSTTACDLSGKPLSNLPKWTLSIGGEYHRGLTLAGRDGEAFLHAEATTRSRVYGDPTDSKYTVIAGYTVVNLSAGFQSGAWEGFFWVKNLFDRDYMQNLTVQAGNSGLVVGTPNDPRTFGFTLRAHY